MKKKFLLSRKFSFFFFFFFIFVDKIYIIDVNRYLNIAFRILDKLKLKNILLQFFKIELVKDGIDIENYPSLESSSREEISKILNTHQNTINKSLSHLLDKQGIKSFYTKGMNYYSGVAYFYKAYAVLKKINNINEKDIYTLFNSEINKILKIKSLINSTILKKVFNTYFKFKLYLKINSMYYLRKFKKYNLKKKFFLSSEVSNYKFLNKEFAEPNYLSDEDNTLYYLTSLQNIEKNNLTKFRKIKNFINLRDIKISKNLKNIFFKSLSDNNELNGEQFNLYRKLFETYSEFDYLFNNFDIEYNIFLQFTNDKRYVRLDSGIVTSLARKYYSKNISYQTRTPYLFDYTFYYDYFDIFFTWSSFWYPKKIFTQNFGKIISIGIDSKNIKEILKKKQVIIFTSDIVNSTHNTKSYNVNLINISKKLANIYPQYQFIIKTKFEDQSKREFKNIELLDNMKYLYGSHDLNKLSDDSTLVIAMGFTSPGFQALIRGTNTIYYSELAGTERELSNFEFVATNYEEVQTLFKKYINDEIDIKKYGKQFNNYQNLTHKEAILKYLKLELNFKK